MCEDYYQRKYRKASELLGALDHLQNERPHRLHLKRKNFKTEGDEEEGSPQRNLQTDLEIMRIKAEKEKIGVFKCVARESGVAYYKVCKRIVERKYEAQELVCYLMDYMKNVIENGNQFSGQNLLYILDTLSAEELQSEGVQETAAFMKEEIKTTPKGLQQLVEAVSDMERRQLYKIIFSL